MSDLSPETDKLLALARAGSTLTAARRRGKQLFLDTSPDPLRGPPVAL